MDKPPEPRALITGNTVSEITAAMERAAPSAAQIQRMRKGHAPGRKYHQYYLELREMLRDSSKETSDRDLAILLRAAIALIAIRLVTLQVSTVRAHITRQ